MARSGHGTVVAKNTLAAPLTFTNIAEMKDVTPPELSRNDFDATTQTLNIDTHILGVLRRSGFTMELNWEPADASHDHLTGLLYSMITEPPPVEGYRITFPSGAVWLMSGQVMNFRPLAPVDGLMALSLTIRPTGKMIIGGTTVG